MGTTCVTWWHRNTSCIEHSIIKVCRKWGFFVARRPLLVILCSLAFALVLSVFVLNIESETDGTKLWAPTGTTSYDNFQEYGATWEQFEDTVGANQLIVAARDDINLFSEDALRFLLSVYDRVADISVEHNAESYSYDDICYRLENGRCDTKSILELFMFDAATLNRTFADEAVSYPTTFSPYSYQPLFVPLVLGQNVTVSAQTIQIASTDSNLSQFETTDFFSSTVDDFDVETVDVVTASPALRMFFSVNLKVYGDALCVKWYEAFLDTMEEIAAQHSDVYDISYNGYNSFDDELARSAGSDITAFVLSFNILSLFSTLMVLRFVRRSDSKCGCACDMARCRGRIGWLGIISAVLSVSSSFGLVGGIFGIKFNSVCSVAPFLLVGLGLDDMFVLLRSYELTSPALSVAERVAETMERGGVSILFTTITDIVAFGIGASSTFGAVSSFCAYCLFGVLLDFFFQVTFFMGFLVFDSRYQSNGELRAPTSTTSSSDNTSMELQIRNADPESPQTANDAGSAETVPSISPTAAPTSTLRPVIDEKAASSLMTKLGNFLLQSVWSKLAVLLLFAVYLAIAIYGVAGLETSQDSRDLAPNDSYLLPFYDSLERYFDTIGQSVQFVLDKPLDYSDSAVRDEVDAMIDDIRADECFLDNAAFTSSWLSSYVAYLGENQYTQINQSAFYDVLYNDFLLSEEGENFVEDLWSTVTTQEIGFSSIDNASSFAIASLSSESISRTRIRLNLEWMGTGTSEYKDCLDNLQSLQNKYESSLGVYYFERTAVFAESELQVGEQTILNLVYAMSAAAFITILLIPFPAMALVAMYTIGQILVGVIGFMSLWGLSISVTTMINIVISVGFSVDNAAHFCHSFINAPISSNGKEICVGAGDVRAHTRANERVARVMYALNAVGMPILLGDVSTILALLPLATAESAIFTSFWKCISLVMIIGLCHATLFLPVVLSICGPLGLESESEVDESAQEVEKIVGAEQEVEKSAGAKEEEVEKGATDTTVEA